MIRGSKRKFRHNEEKSVVYMKMRYHHHYYYYMNGSNNTLADQLRYKCAIVCRATNAVNVQMWIDTSNNMQYNVKCWDGTHMVRRNLL